MEHTFILGTNGNLKGRGDQAAHYLIGILGLLVGILTFLSHDLSTLKTLFGSTMILGGVFNMLLAARAFAEKSRFAPKVTVRANEIEIKPTFTSVTRKIALDDLESISIRKRVLKVTLRNSGKTIKYRTYGCYPFEIREALAHVASKKNVTLL
ncbi:MAG: hypothetical protein RIC35_17595 [Marinoscillum sp.]